MLHPSANAEAIGAWGRLLNLIWRNAENALELMLSDLEVSWEEAMASATRTESIVTRLVGSLSSWLGRRDDISDVRRRSAADINAIANDLRVSRTELQNLASHNCLEGGELLGLLRALGIDDVTLAREELGVIRDMKLICALCVARSRCKRDVERETAVLHYRGYCANSYTLDAIKKMQKPDHENRLRRPFER